MVSDLQVALRVGLALFALAEIVGLTGIVPPPHIWLFESYASPHAVFIAGSIASVFFALYLCSRPPRRELVAVGTGGALLAASYLVLRPHEAARSLGDLFDLVGGACGVAALVTVAVRGYRSAPPQRLLASVLLAAFALIFLYDNLAETLLRLTAALHPRTYDAMAFTLDATLGFSPSTVFALLVNQWPPLLSLVTAAYNFLPFGFAVIYGLQLARPERAPVSMLLAYTVSGAIAVVLYHLCPIAGPRYAFGELFFAWWPGMPAGELVSVRPAPRNGMPSMHFGWALLMWMHASCIGRGMRALFAVLAGLMFVATLGLGQHYLVDLIASPPAIVAVQALCATGLGWNSRERVRALVTGGALTLAWILAVRYGLRLFQALPGLTWLAIAATLAASARFYLPLARALKAAPSAVLRPVSAPRSDGSETPREARYVAVMFVLSGFAALVYQVLFSKALALTFGSTATATYTVLAVYMGGMALGAWLGGWLAARRSDPLRLYALCEIGIGIYCLATPMTFEVVRVLYVVLAGGLPPDDGVLTALRVLLGASALLVPTVLMGMTLPILAKFLEHRAASLGVSVALLYGANTLGAALGALLAGYVMIPALGVWRTTLTAAALNFLVVWLAFRLQASAEPRAAQPAMPRPASVSALDAAPPRRLGRIALVILAVGGVVTLALEVNYIHLLSVVAGNSVYAFSLMLFAFLLGLGLGAELARRLLTLELSLPLALAWLEFTLAAVILVGAYLWEGLPAYFASFESYPMTRGFSARELVRGLVCVSALLPPAVMIGVLYPLAMECVGRAFTAAPIAALGRAAALNTAGNVVGVLAAGFWLLPAVGALRSIQLLAVVCLALGVMAIAVTALRWRPLAWAPAAAVVALLVAQPPAFDYTALASGANVYFAAQNFGRVIDHAESVDGGLTTVMAVGAPGGETRRVLLTNGKFQGTNDLRGEGVAQAGFALAPLLHTSQRERALLIGYGAGMSARVLHDAGFRELEIVELSADIVRLANEHFSDVNGRVTGKTHVRTYITDGRNFLLLQQERRYDLVSMEISSIWFAGAASLYNREFYRLVKRQLAPHGVLQQWVQLHHIHPQDVLYVLGTVRAEFRYVWLYLIGGQGIIVASDDEHAAPRTAYLEKLEQTETLKPLFRSYGGSPRELLRTQFLDPAGIDRLLAGFNLPPSHWVSTDDNLHLEYATPKGNALDGPASFQHNVDLIRKAAAIAQRQHDLPGRR